MQYAVIVEIMGLQSGSLFTPASEAGKKQDESIKRRFQSADDAKALLRG
ncbi:MAG TPA: hypothetical protein VJW96_08155 [Terriglobales bacterium]|nr:hypothetical protein [Terriglobales bacterium]